MFFAKTSQQKTLRSFPLAARRAHRPVRTTTATSRIELFGACLMIGSFLVMAMFG